MVFEPQWRELPYSAIPSLDALTTAVSHSFFIEDEFGVFSAVELESAQAGIPMSKRYLCYNAVFSLPHGVVAGQGTYSVYYQSPDLTSSPKRWQFFMAPIQKNEEDQGRLEVVFHILAAAPQKNSAPVEVLAED